MSTRRLLTAALLTTLAASAWAQNNELAGVAGRTFIADQGIIGATFPNPTVHFGNGFIMEGSYGRQLTPAGLIQLTLEVPVQFNVDEDLGSGTNAIPEGYLSIFITPSARVNFFANTRVSPWLSGGGGYGRFAESSNALYYGPNTGPRGTNAGVIQFGGGLDVRVWPKFSIRGEFRDFWSGTPQLNVDTGKSHQHNLSVGAGVVWHFGK